MANAKGCLARTLLSGWTFPLAGMGRGGLQACRWLSTIKLVLTVLISLGLRRLREAVADS